MKCEKCGHEALRLSFSKSQWLCSICKSVSYSYRIGKLHQSANNPYSPKLTKAKNDVFSRSVERNGVVIDTATGREAEY